MDTHLTPPGTNSQAVNCKTFVHNSQKFRKAAPSYEEGDGEPIVFVKKKLGPPQARCENSSDEEAPSKKFKSTGQSTFKRSDKKESQEQAEPQEVVRKRSERKQLNGQECVECQSYFKSQNLTDEERQKKLNMCSRHRSKTAPSSSPPSFWEIDMPSTPELRRRGALLYEEDGDDFL